MIPCYLSSPYISQHLHTCGIFCLKELNGLCSLQNFAFCGCLPEKNVECGAAKWLGADGVVLWVLISLPFFMPSSFRPLDCPSFVFSPLGWTLCPCALCLILPPSLPPPPPSLCLGPVWVINYSWACSEGPGLLIPAHRGLALIRSVVQLNWKPSYTIKTHTNTEHTHRTCTSRHASHCKVAVMHTYAQLCQTHLCV